MQQRFYFEYNSNGNLSRTEFANDKLYQGQQAAAEYSLKMAVATDVNNWLPSDSVFLNFIRPDSKTASVRMTYDSDFGGWKVTTNGWETDVDISTSSDLTVSFVARRYSTVDAALLVKSMTSESVVLTIYPTADYTPLNIATDDLDTINAELSDHETRISELEATIEAAVEAGDSNLEVIVARKNANNVIFGTLKARLDANDTAVIENIENISDNTSDIVALQSAVSGLASGSPKGTYETLSALETAFPTGTTGVYIVEADGYLYNWSGSAWVQLIQYQSTGIADGSIKVQQCEFNAIEGTKSTNLFDYRKVTDGKYLQTSTGNLLTNASYFTSDFIPIQPDTVYTATSVAYACIYNSAKTFVTGYNSTFPTTFTTPSTASFIRLSQENTYKTTFVLCAGSFLADYENPKNKVKAEDLHTDVADYVVSAARTYYDSKIYVEYLKNISKDLCNPFKKVQIKLIGDSITAGVGGTGYSATGSTIPGTSSKMNLLTGTCWANMLYNLVNTFSKDNYVAMDNQYITYTVTPHSKRIGESSTLLGTFTYLKNTTNNKKGLSFEVYGTYCDIYYTTSSETGIFDIYVDGVIVDTIDTYTATTVYQNVKNLTFDLGTHTILIAETNTKNASATYRNLKIEAVKVNKFATVLNYGASGVQSVHAENTALYEANDDYVFIMIGINDRSLRQVIDTERIIRKAINTNILPDKKLVLMSYPPVSLEQEANESYNFGAWELNNMMASLATSYNIPFVSHYQYFIEYAELKGISVDTLSGDGLHPNDEGYRIIFNHICKCIGLSPKRAGLTI